MRSARKGVMNESPVRKVDLGASWLVHAPQPTPNTADTEAGATPSPACSRVAQASLPAIPDSRPLPSPRQTPPARRPAPRPSGMLNRGAGVPACGPRLPPAPQLPPNIAGTEAGATPSPACSRVAQASLPAIPGSHPLLSSRPTSPAQRPAPRPVRHAQPWRRRPCLRSPAPARSPAHAQHRRHGPTTTPAGRRGNLIVAAQP